MDAADPVVLAPVTVDNWRDAADLAPQDDQRRFVASSAARYLLLGVYGDDWHCLVAYEGPTPVAHVMWARDEDGSLWVGGLLVDAAHQGRGVGRRVMEAVMILLRGHDPAAPVRLSHHPQNRASSRLFEHLGFRPTGAMEEDEIVLEVRPAG